MARSEKISIDIGYGDVKVCTGGNRIFKFPTAIKKITGTSVELGEDPTARLFNGKKYHVGEKALDGALTTRSFEFLKGYSALLIYEAVARSGEEYVNAAKNGLLAISIGLSLKDWNKKDEYTTLLEKINVNNEVLVPQVFLYPQGDGIFAFHDNPEGNIVVVDIGYNTFDFLVYLDRRPQREACFATAEGANMLVREVKKYLTKKYSLDFTEQEVNKHIANGHILIGGKKDDLGEIITDAKEGYAEHIANQMLNNNETLLRKADRIIFSGGGSYYLEGADIEKYLGIENSAILPKDNAEYENVIGYFKKMERILNASE